MSKEEDGIIVGSDQTQEWLLPWWWKNFSRHNQLPVTFIDFGLSAEKREWCRKRGELLPLSLTTLYVKEREEIAPALVGKWEERYGDFFWVARKGWFKKPFACLQSPYRRTVWLDLDCEVLGPLNELFNACEHPSGIALAKDRAPPPSPFPIYNSGVIVFQKDLSLLQEWAKQSLKNNGAFRGDQDLLSKILFDQNLPIYELPFIYNWNVGYGVNGETVICHWIGEAAKAALRNQIILNEL